MSRATQRAADGGFRLVVFDWDGTLMDSVGRIVACFQAVIAELEFEPRAAGAIRDIIGLGLPEAFECLYPEAGEASYRLFCTSYRRHFFAPEGPPAVLFSGARQMLQSLRDTGLLLGVATGKGRRGLNKALVETQCTALIHASRCAEETFSKPHPQMLLELMQEAGVQPHETLMVGDTEYDLQMAANAGTAAVAVTSGAHELNRLLAHGPMACFDGVAEIGPWLLGTGSDRARRRR